MHRAIAPAIMRPALIPGVRPLSLIAEFSLGRSTDYTGLSTTTSDFQWNVIRFQSGFSPVLSGTITTVAVPSGSLYFQGVFSTRSGNAEDGFFQQFISVDGAETLRQSSHGSDYLTNSVSGWCDVDGASTVAARMSVTNTGDSPDAAACYFGGRFWG